MSPSIHFTSRSVKETEQWACQFAQGLRARDFVALYGDLGAGKTAFVRGMAAGLGDAYASSPTFSIVHEYQTTPIIYHFDVYRLQGEDDLEAIGYEEYLAANGIIVMEWPQRVETMLPVDRFSIDIQTTGANERQYSLTAYGKAAARIDEMQRRLGDEDSIDHATK
jgi:ATPase, YjeE family